MLAQFAHHWPAVTIPDHSDWLATWYHVAQGHCLCSLVHAHELSHQLFVISVLAHVYGLGSDQFHTNQYVSVHAFNQILQSMVVDCCVASPKANHLFLHHWKYCHLDTVQSVLAVVAHTLQADIVYQAHTQLHTIISAVSHHVYVVVAENGVGVFTHVQVAYGFGAISQFTQVYHPVHS